MRKCTVFQLAALLTCCCFFVSCKNEIKFSVIEASKVEELRIYFVSQYQKVDPTAELDSFEFMKLDTLTKCDQFRYLTDEALEIYQHVVDSLKGNYEDIQDAKRRIDLYASISPLLRRTTNEDYSQAVAKFNKTDSRAEDAQNLVFKYRESMKTADRTKTIGYQATCLYQMRFKDQSVKKDTTCIVLNRDMNIVDKKDFFKEGGSF